MSSVILHTARPSDVEGNYVFTIVPVYDSAVQDPADLVFELQLDTASNFESVNKRSYFSNGLGLVQHQQGEVACGMVVALPGRTQQDVVWYFRARTALPGKFLENWSDTKTLTVVKNESVQKGLATYAATPDHSVYSLEAASTHFARLISCFCQEKSALDLEVRRVQDDFYLSSSRDEALQVVFGFAAQFAKPESQNAADYRHQLLTLWRALVSYPGSLQAVVDYVTSVTGEPPLFIEMSSPEGWVLPYHYLPDPDFPSLSPTILLYPRPIDGNEFTIYVFNSWDVEIDEDQVEEWIHRLKPAHVKATVIFPTQKHTSVRFNTAATWGDCSISGGTIVGDSVRMNSSPMTIITPEIDATDDVNAWDFAQWNNTLSGQSMILQIRSKPAGGSFTAWETFTPGGHSPFTTPIQRFFQLQVISTSSDASLYQPIINSLEFFYLRA